MPTFAHACARIDAVILARTRGGDVQTDAERATIGVQSTWQDWRGQQARVRALTIVSTRQPFGGLRWWWVCPNCRRRCGVLYLPDREGPVACRSCWPVRYLVAYPGRQRARDAKEALFMILGHEDLKNPEQEALFLRRRRGVRRGRRVLRRAAQEALKAWRRSDALVAGAELIRAYGAAALK